MKITKVNIFHFEGKTNKVKAFASVTFDDAFVLTGIKVLSGKKGDYVGMPNNKTKSGEYKDVAFPITKELREELNSSVMTAYQESVKTEE